MLTKREVLDAANRGEGALGKAADDEPVFVLRAQDIHAPDLVEKWAIWCRAHQAPNDKLREAHGIADAMRAWPGRRQPD